MTRRSGFAAAEAADPQDDAALLRGVVRDCVGAGVARRGLLLRLSGLPGKLAQAHHLRLARAALEPLAGADRAQLFRLPNSDLVMVWRGEAAAALQASLDTLLHLFADEKQLLPDPGALMLTLRLPEDAAMLLGVVDDSLLPSGKAADEHKAATEPLDPPALAALEAALAQADMSRFVRRLQICAPAPGGKFSLSWEKRTLSVPELAAALSPERAVRADPWLFRRLTRTLDRRMLALLAAPGELHGAGPFGLDLNVASVLSPEFLRFDAALPASLRGQVVIGLLPADSMADPAAFQFARDFAHARGYRLLLRGITADLLEVFPLRRIGLDLLQLRFSPDLTRLDGDEVLADPSRTLLSHANDAAALAWGRAHGVALYQGRAVRAG